jgi:hypothetical protein
MKLIIVVLVSVSPALAQVDMTTNPSRVGFGGAMGGGLSSGPPPATTTAPGATGTTTPVPQSNTTLELPRGNDFPRQQMQDPTNFAGGALGGAAPTGTNVPATPATPTGALGTGSGTGVGTGVGVPGPTGTTTPGTGVTPSSGVDVNNRSIAPGSVTLPPPPTQPALPALPAAPPSPPFPVP